VWRHHLLSLAASSVLLLGGWGCSSTPPPATTGDAGPDVVQGGDGGTDVPVADGAPGDAGGIDQGGADVPGTDGGDGGGPSLTVTTDKGPVTGTTAGTTRVFYNIPYAAPPVGPLRWKPPQPAQAWTQLDATTRGPVCPQFAPGGTALAQTADEDCLQLNVWAPPAEGASALPVMLFIHGGGFTLGSGTDRWYDGRALAEATGHVVVTINYRLGPLGFLAHSALDAEDTAHASSGNYGLEDQRAAMAWVQTNIAAFGGDPAQVTLFGESAGGTSICLHLLSPLGAGLFARAVIESGPCDSEVFSAGIAHAQGDQLTQALGCDTASDVLACLRGKDPATLLSALGGSGGLLGGADGVWQPVVDGYNLPDHPRVMLDAGQVSQQVPVLVGNNQNEGNSFTQAVTDDAAYQAAVQAMLGGGQLASDVLAEYPSSDFASPQQAASEVFGDSLFVCTARRMARAFTGNGQAVYRYQFNHGYDSVVFPGGGAFHSAELPFVFGNNFPGHNITADERPLTEAMQGYWGTFAEVGQPNVPDGPTMWPLYDTASDPYLQLDLTIAAAAGLKTDKCDFWDAHPLPR
jgi:para-nitrobenzyl esterase